MSTSSKLQDTQIQGGYTNSHKSLLNSQSQPINLAFRNQSNDSSSDMEQNEVLHLEIKQLRRQNDFLKKKIGQLAHANKGHKSQIRKSTNKGINREEKQQVHLTVEFFFEQINQLLKSVIEMFHLDLSPSEITMIHNQLTEDDTYNPSKKYSVIKKYTLNRQLQKIMLEPQQNRYLSLLETFTNFYKAKEESENYIKSIIDDLSTKALNLNKMILDKAQKKSLKRSEMKSQFISERVLFDNMDSESGGHIKEIDNELFEDLDLNDRKRIERALGRIV